MPKGLVTLNFSSLELITLHPSRTAMPEEDNDEIFVEDTDEEVMLRVQTIQIGSSAGSSWWCVRHSVCSSLHYVHLKVLHNWAPCKSCSVMLFIFACCKQCIIVYSPCCGRFRGYVPPPWKFWFFPSIICFFSSFRSPGSSWCAAPVPSQCPRGPPTQSWRESNLLQSKKTTFLLVFELKTTNPSV